MDTKICNVVCTANLEQKIDITKLGKLSCGIYDNEIYGGRCGYVKTPEMSGKVTIFSSGKMISVGAKSIQESKEQLNRAKFYLLQEKIIQDIKISPKIQNIVAITDIKKKIPMRKLSSKIQGASYNPETFSGVILKDIFDCSFLIFNSGKIVQTKGKSLTQIKTELNKVVEILRTT